MPLRMPAAGDRAVLIELDGLSSRELHAVAARVSCLPHVSACVTGQQSLYVIGDPPPSRDELESTLNESDASVTLTPRVHRIDVSFAPEYGPDLPDLLMRSGMTTDELLSRLSDVTLSARFLGFRAGFAYLDGWPEEWQLPRRATARSRVPAGSFGTAGPMAGFYPAESPGGWNLLGRTAAALWLPDREPPALIAAGDEVRIIPTLEPLAAPLAAQIEAGSTGRTPAGERMATVVSPGQNSVVVRERDERRLAFGVAAGGPFDREAAAAANLQVGNSAGAPLIECVLVGPTLHFESGRRVAWSGAGTGMRVDEKLIASGDTVGAGQTLSIGRLHGLRGWLAIEGGVDDGCGRYEPLPQRLVANTTLHEAQEKRGAPVRFSIERPGDGSLLRAMAGPHSVPAALLRDVERHEWEVTPLLDRVGIRLRAAVTSPVPAVVASSGSLPSIGAQFGSVQWHPDGTLVILGPDHPVTGGYLQPFTLRSDELWKTAQLAPGVRVRFVIDV